MENEKLGNEERKFFNVKPNIDFFADLSKDGKYFRFKVVFTFIKPVSYIQAILRNFYSDSAKESGPSVA